MHRMWRPVYVTAIGALTFLVYVSGWWRERIFELLPLAVCIPFGWFMYKQLQRKKPSLTQCIIGFLGCVGLAAWLYFFSESSLSYKPFAVLWLPLVVALLFGGFDFLLFFLLEGDKRKQRGR